VKIVKWAMSKTLWALFDVLSGVLLAFILMAMPSATSSDGFLQLQHAVQGYPFPWLIFVVLLIFLFLACMASGILLSLCSEGAVLLLKRFKIIKTSPED